MESELDIFYDTTLIESASFESIVELRVNSNDTNWSRHTWPLRSFTHVDIEFKGDYLITFRPGHVKVLKKSLRYDKDLYNYIVNRLAFVTDWSIAVIKSYFIYEH